MEAKCIVDALLEARGVFSEEERENFLNPRLQNLADPLRLPDIREAVERVERAIAHGEEILIYSDYDVDGMTSGALMFRFLKTLGARVDVFLPERISEGYGLTLEGLSRALQSRNPKLLIALDCGTTSVKEIQHLNEHGIEVIVIDHHELPQQLPAAIALVNPHRSSEDDHALATVGLVFKFCHALLKLRDAAELFDLKKHLDIVALGTVADLAPLQNDNRIFVQQGLKHMAKTQHVGLRELIRRAGVKGTLTSTTCGFILGPRLNASGRMAQGRAGWELLATDDGELARQIAEDLESLNRKRQKVEQDVMNETEAWMEKNFDAERDRGIVVASRDWHQGVVGIVASRLMRRYHRPTIVIAVDEKGQCKGSCRSVEDCSLMDVLRGCGEDLEAFGGHAMAAGIEINEDKIESFREHFNAWLRENVSEECFHPKLHIDFELRGHELNGKLASELDKMEPFGRGNPEPVFMVREAEFTSPLKIFNQRHLKFRARAEGNEFDVVAFNMAKQVPPSRNPTLAGHWEIDDYSGFPCFRLVDWMI